MNYYILFIKDSIREARLLLRQKKNLQESEIFENR